MRPVRPVYIAAQAVTPFIGKGHPDFILKGHPDFGKRENPTLEDHLVGVVRQLLAECQIDPSLIQRGYVGNFAGELFSNQGFLGAMLGRADERLAGIGCARVEAACASGGVGIVGAIESIQAGLDVVLVEGAEVQTTVRPREGADYLARASHYATERSIDDFTFPALLARRAKAYKEAYGRTDRDLAHFSVKAYANANRNPRAHMHTVKMTLEQAAPRHTNPNLQNPAQGASQGERLLPGKRWRCSGHPRQCRGHTKTWTVTRPVCQGAFVWFLYQPTGASQRPPPARHDCGSDGGGTAGCWHDPARRAGRGSARLLHDRRTHDV
jgi:hypothetical protein